MIVIVMGVSGSGKTDIGGALAQRLDCVFLDADDFHSPANVAKMHQGDELTDEDRQPWLQAMNCRLREEDRCMLACSALKLDYRSVLCDGLINTRWIYLKVDFDTARERMTGREHFMPVELLESQFETLEEPIEIPGLISVDATQPVDEIVKWLMEIVELN